MGYLDYSGLSHFLDKLKTIFILSAKRGTANGVASLDNSGKVPISQLPDFVNDVIEGYYYNNKFYEELAHTTEITGKNGKIYTSVDTNKIYRFNGTDYSEIANADVMTGATASTAGKAGIVPIPAAGKQIQYLKGDGTWDSPAMSELGFSVVNGKICATYQKEVEE